MGLFQQLFSQYDQYHVPRIETNRFPPEQYYAALKPLAEPFSRQQIGQSVAGRPIYAVTLGSGPLKVLLWSQMHGNESTASRAILDILHFFTYPKNLASFCKGLLAEMTICIVPVLNPDGTARFQRRNALGIDLNRDARAFTAPESQVLRQVVADFDPDFAFNLHDQRRFYNVQGTRKPSTIAFLAPAYNAAEDIDKSRATAMQLIAFLREELEGIIPGQVGLYDDTYTPRAFGDYVQGTRASTILVEAGWEKHDMEKEFVRKLNFCLLITAFAGIANRGYNSFFVTDYQRIPMNDERLFDVLIRNVQINAAGAVYNVDMGISREEISDGETGYYSRGLITDIGDLREWYGFEELDATGLQVKAGKVLPEPVDLKMRAVKKLPEAVATMLGQGYLFCKVKDGFANRYVNLPVNIVNDGFTPPANPEFEREANFLLTDADGKIKYLLVNGFMWAAGEPWPENANGLNMR